MRARVEADRTDGDDFRSRMIACRVSAEHIEKAGRDQVHWFKDEAFIGFEVRKATFVEKVTNEETSHDTKES